MADMTTDWSECDAVEKVPDRMGGVLVFKNTRLPISHLFIVLRDGGSTKDFLEWYPEMTEHDVRAVLSFLKDNLEREWAEKWDEGKYTEFATMETKTL